MPPSPGPFAAALTFITSPHTRTSVFLAVAALVTAIAAALTFRRAITPWSSLPDSDYWGNISRIVTDSGVRALKSMAGLKSLNLYHTLITEKAMKEIQSALPTCEIVFDRDSALPNRRSALK